MNELFYTTFVGFVGVSLAGFILDIGGSWAAVFNLTALFSLCGGLGFLIFGTGEKII